MLLIADYVSLGHAIVRHIEHRQRATIAEGDNRGRRRLSFWERRFRSPRGAPENGRSSFSRTASRSSPHRVAREGANPRARALGMDDVRRNAHHDDTSPTRSEVRRRLCTLREASTPFPFAIRNATGLKNPGGFSPHPPGDTQPRDHATARAADNRARRAERCPARLNRSAHHVHSTRAAFSARHHHPPPSRVFVPFH